MKEVAYMSIAAMGFKKSSANVQPRVIISVEGREKQGKTNFALTSPSPIALFDFDTGLEGVINKFAKKTIWVSEYRTPILTADQYIASWERYKREFRGALADKTIKTIIVDSETECWELIRMARFGKLTEVMPHYYAPVNAEYRELIRAAFGSDKNLVLIHKMSMEYIANKTTGRFLRAGFKETASLVQVNAVAWRDEEGVFHFTIRDCRQNPALAGMDFTDDMINFPVIASLVLPDTTPGDWL